MSPPDVLPSIEEFTETARAWLAERYPTAPAAGGKRRFVWGEGSDEVRVFQEPDPDTEVDALPAIRRWRAGLWEAGYGWISGPAEYGGAGLPAAYQRAFEQLSRQFDVPGDSALTIGLGMIAPTILSHGTEDQKRSYLPALYSGTQIACQLFSEPGAGSDLASISTKAVRDGAVWRITGQKVWTSGAHISDVGEIICRTAVEPRHKNLTAFLIDMHAPGVSVRPLRQMTGGAAFNEVFFDDVVVPDSDRLGAEGEGWAVAMTTLAHERNAMGHSSFGGVGILSTERLVGLVRSQGLAEDAAVRQQFGEVVSHLRSARYLNEVIAAQARAGRPPGAEIGLSKVALSNNMRRLGEFVGEVLGPELVADSGQWGTYAWSSLVLGAPGYRLGGGTDEVLKNTVAQRVLGLPRAT
ncbi:MAG TPA: acyl-CoA dehydrogenase family protein [Sporichthya sp.]|nr:acyl-CoA dehydrogenase family protein [Sporichthya sp.]